MISTSYQFPILYEDNELLVINKPAGVVVNRAESVKDATVQDWAERRLKVSHVAKVPNVSREDFVSSGTSDTFDTFISRSGIVHRIDKETSGCLLMARNSQTFLALQTLFKEKKVYKTYIALLHGKLVPEEGSVNAPVGRLPWNREQFGVVPGGKESVTRYKVVSYYSSSDERSEDSRSHPIKGSSRLAVARSNNKEIFTLVELYPETGRTHQIRVHMKYLGFPLVGDYLYAGRKQQRDDREWCPRVFLHAAKISFLHPQTGKTITVEAPLPDELQQVLNSLR